MKNQKIIEIKNPELYQKIEKADDKWKALFADDEGTLEDERIPTLAGGLDHIKEKKDRIIFVDIGVSKNDGKTVDNTFAVINEK